MKKEESEFLQSILEEIESEERSRKEGLRIGAGDYYIIVNLLGTLEEIKAMIEKRLKEMK